LPINCSYFIFALGLRRIDPGGIDPMWLTMHAEMRDLWRF
jgi:hypothetical protein